MQKKTVMALSALLAVGAARGAENVVGSASGVYVCTDPSRSLLWKTITDERMEIPVVWPSGAVAATLTVTSDCGETTAVPVPDDADVLSVEFVLPDDEAAERVVTLALAFTDADGAPLDGLGQVATLGLVRGANGRSARCVPNTATRRWRRRKEGRAVISVPEGVESVALDGGEAVAVEAPGWFAWSGLENGAHEVVAGDAAVTFEVVPGGVVIFIR